MEMQARRVVRLHVTRHRDDGAMAIFVGTRGDAVVHRHHRQRGVPAITLAFAVHDHVVLLTAIVLRHATAARRRRQLECVLHAGAELRHMLLHPRPNGTRERAERALERVLERALVLRHLPLLPRETLQHAHNARRAFRLVVRGQVDVVGHEGVADRVAPLRQLRVRRTPGKRLGNGRLEFHLHGEEETVLAALLVVHHEGRECAKYRRAQRARRAAGVHELPVPGTPHLGPQQHRRMCGIEVEDLVDDVIHELHVRALMGERIDRRRARTLRGFPIPWRRPARQNRRPWHARSHVHVDVPEHLAVARHVVPRRADDLVRGDVRVQRADCPGAHTGANNRRVRGELQLGRLRLHLVLRVFLAHIHVLEDPVDGRACLVFRLELREQPRAHVVGAVRDRALKREHVAEAREEAHVVVRRRHQR
eukprot:31048-Pelagococcus_subviridis.AAC.4